jgi:ketosteroid isomerase-like protein
VTSSHNESHSAHHGSAGTTEHWGVVARSLQIGQALRVTDNEHPEPIPETVRTYLEAHDRRDTDVALSAFAPDARVFDDGHEYHGLDAIHGWLARASTQFTYTRTFLTASAEGPETWLIRNRLEGNFPGGVVDLQYRFTLVNGLIADLAIVP